MSSFNFSTSFMIVNENDNACLTTCCTCTAVHIFIVPSLCSSCDLVTQATNFYLWVTKLNPENWYYTYELSSCWQTKKNSETGL